MLERGFSCHYSNNGEYRIYYANASPILKIYFPDEMARGKNIRLSGSIGFAVVDQHLNGGHDLDAIFDPKNELMFLIRLENYLDLIKLGYLHKEDFSGLIEFLNSLISRISDIVPDNFEEIGLLYKNENSWLYKITRGECFEKRRNYIEMIIKNGNDD